MTAPEKRHSPLQLEPREPAKTHKSFGRCDNGQSEASTTLEGMDRSIQLLLRELDALRDASGYELCQALEAALHKRSRIELVNLEASFTRAQFPQLAQMCRSIIGSKVAPH